MTREDKNETIHQTIAFINDRLKDVSREVDSVTASLLRYKKENNIIDVESQSSAYFNRIEKYDESINEQRVQINIAQIINDYLRNRDNDYNLVPSSLGLTDGTLSTMIAAYNVSQLERKKLIDSNVPLTNARVQQNGEEIESLRESILESLHNLTASYSAAILRFEENTHKARAQMDRLPQKEQGLLEIQKQLEMKQAVYNLLMEKREESAISSAATISNIKILEEAGPNNLPIRPNRKSVQLIALIIGLAVPISIISIIELFNDKVNNRGDIEKITQAPVIGEIGHAYGEDMLVVRSHNRGVVAEQFRIIRSNLQYVLSNLKKPVLLVTSSFSGEGKSFISTNLGAVMSLANKKTIILEFDIRKPKILSGLSISKKPGLTNYLLGKASLEELPIPVTGYDHLYVLACGPVPPNPAETLLDKKLADLFTFLKQNFDIIIIDTAPVGMVSDAMTLSQFADATLYIVRQGHTFKKQVGLIDEFYQQKKLPKISLILNDVKVRSGYSYYGYGRYGYGKGYGGYGYGYGSTYGYGYFDDKEPKPTLLQNWLGWMGLQKKQNKNQKKAKV
jgi:capsular exopolysaccharide synthesis family protein